MSNSKIFFYVCAAFISGIGIAAFLLERSIGDGFVFFPLAVISLLISFYYSPKKIFIAYLLIASFFFGIWRYGLTSREDDPNKIWYHNGQAVEFEGVVSAEPEKKESWRKLEIDARKLVGPGKKIEGKVLANVPMYPEFAIGDQVRAECLLAPPEKIENFAYDRYLARYGIYSLCKKAKIKKIGVDEGWTIRFRQKLIAFKEVIREKINRQLGGPEAKIALATLLADRGLISEELKDDFSRSGLTHIIAVSGTHISIFAAVLMEIFLLAGLWRRQAFWLSFSFLAIYIILVGAPASALRAGVMGFIFLYALNIGRLGKMHIALFFAAAVLLLFNPKLLRDDVGFQLSFLAILGSGMFYEKWRDKMAEWRIFRSMPDFVLRIADIFLMTLTAQLFTIPIVAYNFKSISLIAPIANILALWIVPFIFISLLSGLALSFLIPPLSFFFFLPAKIFLWYLIKVAVICASFPWASISL